MKQIVTGLDKAKVPLASIFISFLKLGFSSFGGPAIVPHIQRMVVERKKWLQDEVFRYGVAICQILPGVITMNTASYAGLKIRGMAGAALAFTGFGLPVFILMLVLSILYIKFNSLPSIISIFTGLKMIIIAIMAEATLSYGRKTVISWREIIITLFAAILFWLGINPILVIIAAAIAGIILYFRTSIKPLTSESETDAYSLKPVLFIIAIVILALVSLFIFNQDLFTLAAVMMRISIFSFGGGYTSVPLMFHEVVEVRHWITESMFLDGMVLGQITPGPFAMTATFVGYAVYGLPGAIITTLSMLLPSFIITVLVVPYFARINRSPYFNKAIYGILCSFVGLLITVTIRFATGIEWGIIPIIFTVAAFIVLLFKIDILWVVLGGAVISVLIFRQ
jgi:chromate transporter